MRKVHFENAMNFFKKGMALVFLVLLGLPTRAQSLDADRYEPNNTVGTATSLTAVFAKNASTVTISSVNCHVADDVDYYKIELPLGYSYIFGAELYDADTRQNRGYTLNAKISFSTDGITWSSPVDDQLLRATAPAGTLYLKIEPFRSGDVGIYAAKIDLSITATAGCVYTLPTTSHTATGDAAASDQQVRVAAEDRCFWTAISNDDWITLTAGESGTGSGNVSYSYSKNRTWDSRTGTITIAGQTYTVTQGPQIPRPIPPDSYEPNDTKETATPLTAIFNENAGAVSISSVNCHDVNDVDYYKIELGVGYSYLFSGELYGFGNSHYTLDAKMSYSTDNGSTWSFLKDSKWTSASASAIVPGGSLYLKIEPYYSGRIGTYAAKINLYKSAAVGCAYTLSAISHTVTAEAANQEVTVTTAPSCFWTAVSNNYWIALTANQSGVGSGRVAYSCKANRADLLRIGTLTIAGQVYTVTQAGRPLLPDGYEPNDTMAEAYSFTPAFTQNENATVIDISSANCHVTSDIDYYKIELPDGYSYLFSAELYDISNQNDNSNYTADVKISYSTNGYTWSSPSDSRLLSKVAPSGTLYLKIEAYWGSGSYETKIEISKYTTVGCTYSLPSTNLSVTTERGANQVEVTTAGASCAWAAFSDEDWLTLTDGQSGIGLGSVSYSYTENTGLFSRTGAITIAGRAYTAIQAPRLLPLDRYEPNNTVAQAYSFTPNFTQNVSVIDISSANCHVTSDIDYYKIKLPDGYSYLFSAELYDADNSIYTLDTKIAYSTDNGSTWSSPADSRLSNVAVQGENLYLKIEPFSSGQVGAYAAKIDLRVAASTGCAYTLSATSLPVTADGGSNEVEVRIGSGSACAWTAVSHVNWITLTAGQSAIGAGKVAYSYKANRAMSSRTGTITIAGQAYTVAQVGRPLLPDEYEQGNSHSQNNNNTAEEAYSFTPFTQNENATVIDISTANCHAAGDIDIYKIELPDGYSYLFSAELYDKFNQNDNSNYTLDAKIAYSTDNGVVWSSSSDSQLSRRQVQEGTLYLKIEPFYSGHVGTYAAKIDLRKLASTECAYALSPVRKDVTEEAGANQVEVAVGSSCAWTAYSNVNWITLTAGQSGVGSGSVRYSYKANRAEAYREGTITIADKTYTLIQDGLPLLPDAYERSAENNRNNNTAAQAYSFTPVFTQSASVIDISSATAHEVGDVDYYKIELPTGTSYIFSAELYDANNYDDNYTLNAKISYSTDNGATWSATADRQLFGVPAQGGNLYLKIEPFSSGGIGTYAAKIDITALCAYEVYSSIQQASATSAIGQVEVRTTAICAWTAVSNASWITIPTGQNLVGTKNLNFSYETNPTREPRTGTMTVAGETVTVLQASGVCSFTLPSTPIAASQAAGTGKVSVRAAFDDCAWTATTSAPWITIPTGQTLVGTKELNFSYSANLSGIPRTGTITIAGETVTVTQAGIACSYTLSPTSMAVFSAAGTGKVSVRAASTTNDCQWTAVPNAPWITIPTGQTLAGSKELNFSYGENPTNAPREGTITIAGQTFTVRQSSVITGFETASPVKIFPNPAKDFVTIEISSSDQEWISLKIANIFGQAFYERTNPEHKMQIPLTGFSSGLYFIVLQGKEKAVVQKLIIE